MYFLTRELTTDLLSLTSSHPGDLARLILSSGRFIGESNVEHLEQLPP